MFADAHCDTITRILDTNENLYENTGHIDLKRLIESKCCMQFFAIFIHPKFEHHYSFDRFLDAIDKFYYEYEKNKDKMILINSAKDVDNTDGKVGALLTIEGGSAIGKSLPRLRAAYRMGVRLMTLTWNGRNDIADGVFEGENAGGLSLFGKEVVKEMNRLGMIIDVSHLSEKGFFDVASISTEPFFASHSNCKALCGFKRNLTDEQIKIIIKKGGYIGLNFCSDFLHDNGSDILDIIRHAEHILSLGGENVLGFGADFDGVDVLPNGINSVADMNKLTNEFCKLGYNQSLLNRLFYGNLCNSVKQILKK